MLTEQRRTAGRPGHRTGQRGFTLVEVSIILLVLVILSMIMLPQMGNFNRLGRFVKAKEDLVAICASAKKMIDEVMLGTFYDDPGGDDHVLGPVSPIGLIVGPGAAPVGGSIPNGDAEHNIGGADGWYEPDIPAGDCLQIDTDQGNESELFSCDFLVNHLQSNFPQFGFPYKNVFDDVDPVGGHPGLQNTLVGGIHGWRGPYLDALQPDPWGNRYMINSFALWAPPGG